MLRVNPGATTVPWRELRRELRGFVAGRVSAAEVDDVVQEALVRIHRGIPEVRDRERLAPWIYRVTRNAIVDHHRRARPASQLDREPEAVAPGNDDAVPARLLAPCLRGFVAMLPPVYRQAITMVELEGLSQVEAAARLVIPVSTMKARIQRGRARLRELVERCCAIELDARGGVIDVIPRGGGCARCEAPR